MSCQRLRTLLFVMFLLLGLASCGSSQSLSQHTAALRLEPPVVGTSLPSPASLPRSASDSSEFLIQQPGADYAADLPSNGCILNGKRVELTSEAAESGGPVLAQTAYCLYRLGYDPLQTPVKLSLAWETAPTGQCWVGLSDWPADRWYWQLLPAGGELELAEPARFANEQQQTYVAVVVQGGGTSSLSTIGFGDPPPSSEGYTLIAPLFDTNSYLVDMEGNVVHNWSSSYQAGAHAVLLEDGSLLRGANVPNGNFGGGGRSGRIERFSWDGTLQWSYQHSTATETTHHDFRLLPNGNVLLVLWYFVPDAEVIALGRDPATINPGTFLADAIIEVEPTFPSGGNIVWEWRALDHTVQDFDPLAANYGDPGEHPELIDINQPLGSAGDWIHVNSVDYNPELDQIMITTPYFCEIWIIDHSTTSAEAAGHSGGVQGRGGDLLYRWGNPQSYRSGTDADQQINFCHNGQWILDGLEGAGDILIFDNQPSPGETGDAYSSTVQITPPLNPDGSYTLDGASFGPLTPSWEYVGTPPSAFYSPIMSGCQRLPGGGTLICEATSGFIFEIDADKNVIWDYQATLGAAESTFVFRAQRYTYDFPGVANLLTP